jgi:hypothetical protein
MPDDGAEGAADRGARVGDRKRRAAREERMKRLLALAAVLGLAVGYILMRTSTPPATESAPVETRESARCGRAAAARRSGDRAARSSRIDA